MPAKSQAQQRMVRTTPFEVLPTGPLFLTLRNKLADYPASADGASLPRANGQKIPTRPLPKQPRSVFLPEALSALQQIVDEAWQELLADGAFSPPLDAGQMRTRLAKKVMQFAFSGRSEIQTRQLLLRTFRNEVLAARYSGFTRGSVLTRPPLQS
jgi:hypothetical protein